MVEPPIAVTAALIRRGDRLLVCQRSASSAHPGKWEFPGGKLEPGESLTDCMRRELDEELGIDAIVGEVVWRTLFPRQRPTIELTFFDIPGFTGELTNRVFAQVCWVPIEDLGGLDLLAADLEFLAAVRRGEALLPDSVLAE